MGSEGQCDAGAGECDESRWWHWWPSPRPCSCRFRPLQRPIPVPRPTSSPGPTASGPPRGVRRSRWTGCSPRKARAWAQTMADAHHISHSHLSDGVSADWRRLGENVGTGPSVDAIHTALVHSPEHYRNLMDPGFRYVGVGVVSINGTIFVSEVFMELASQPAPSTSASAAGTPSSSAHQAATAAPWHAAPAPLPPPPPQAAPELVATIARLRGLDPS